MKRQRINALEADMDLGFEFEDNSNEEEMQQFEMAKRCSECFDDNEGNAVLNIFCLVQRNLEMAREVAMNYYYRLGEDIYYYIANGEYPQCRIAL